MFPGLAWMPSSIRASRRTSTLEHMKRRTAESLSGIAADVQTQVIPTRTTPAERVADGFHEV